MLRWAPGRLRAHIALRLNLPAKRRDNQKSLALPVRLQPFLKRRLHRTLRSAGLYLFGVVRYEASRRGRRL